MASMTSSSMDIPLTPISATSLADGNVLNVLLDSESHRSYYAHKDGKTWLHSLMGK